MNKDSTQNSTTDWHCHILPGIDDGPASMEEAVDMAAMLARMGFTSVCCTPHMIKGCFEADNESVIQGIASLQSELDRRDIPLKLLAGREYCQDEFFAEHLNSPLLLGGTSFLLMEIPCHSLPDLVRDTCYRITCRGYTPMIAHPERCPLFDIPAAPSGGLRNLLNAVRKSLLPDSRNTRRQSPQNTPEAPAANNLLAYLLDLGCAFQGNLRSFSGGYGRQVQFRAEKLRELGVYSHFGTDAHSVAQLKDIRTGTI